MDNRLYEVYSKDHKTYVFIEFVDEEGDVPYINFNFGTADPTIMDYKTLGRIIAITKKYTIELFYLCKEHEEPFITEINEEIIFKQSSADIFTMDEHIELKFSQ